MTKSKSMTRTTLAWDMHCREGRIERERGETGDWDVGRQVGEIRRRRTICRNHVFHRLITQSPGAPAVWRSIHGKFKTQMLMGDMVLVLWGST